MPLLAEFLEPLSLGERRGSLFAVHRVQKLYLFLFFQERQLIGWIKGDFSFIDHIQQLDELTPAVLYDMVKAVYVHAPDKSKGHREQQIDISYDLVEILPASLLNDLHNRETS